MIDTRSTVSARRRRTRDLLLATLSTVNTATRGDLGRLTGLSPSAISDGIAQLHADDLVDLEPGPPSAGGRGRRAELIRLRRSSGIVVGIDFGHAHVAAAVATTAGQVLAEYSQPLDVDTRPAHALDAASTLAHRALRTAGIPINQVVGIAAGLPRPVDLRTDVMSAPTIESAWTGLDPASELRRRLHHPVTIGNDADMGARGEHAYGAGRGVDDFIYLKASHGIGLGLMLAGRLHHGATGIAGEIGHTQVPGATDWCRCGGRGCLEAITSVGAVRRQLTHVLGLPGEADLPPLAELCSNTADRVLTDAGRTLGRVLADLVNCLNPAAVIIGGELASAGRPLTTGVREAINHYAEPASARAVTVTIAQLGERAELLGAVAAAAEGART